MRYAVYKYTIKEDCGICLYESGELIFTNGDSVKIRSREEFANVIKVCDEYNFLDAIFILDMDSFKLVHNHVINIDYDIKHMLKLKDNSIEIRDLASLNPEVKEDKAIEEVKAHLKICKNRKVPTALAGYAKRAFGNFCLKNYNWYKYFKESKLFYTNYLTAYYANKAGYVQPNYCLEDHPIGSIVDHVYKWDAKSYYAAQFMKHKFPLGALYDYPEGITLVDVLRDSKLDYTVFCRLKIKKLTLKPYVTMPYIKKDDLVFSKNLKTYGNAVVYAEDVCICVHSITLKWLIEQYILEGIEVKNAFRQVNLPLPKDLLKIVDEFFKQKCEIGQKKINGHFENACDELMYGISKVILSSGCFGIWCHDPLKYKRKELNFRDRIAIDYALDEYYNNSHTFTIYQVGIMVCAYALDEIFTLIERVGYDNVLYTCVDSIAVIGAEANEIIEEYNEELKKKAPYIMVNGKKEIYGEFEPELTNDKMCVLGANCYCVEENGVLYSKISGVPDSGWLDGKLYSRDEEIGSIENFKPKFEFKACTPVLKEEIPFGYRWKKRPSVTIKENMTTIG